MFPVHTASDLTASVFWKRLVMIEKFLLMQSDPSCMFGKRAQDFTLSVWFELREREASTQLTPSLHHCFVRTLTRWLWGPKPSLSHLFWKSRLACPCFQETEYEKQELCLRGVTAGLWREGDTHELPAPHSLVYFYHWKQ